MRNASASFSDLDPALNSSIPAVNSSNRTTPFDSRSNAKNRLLSS